MFLPESADGLHERLGVGHDVDTVRKPDGGQNEIFWDPLKDTHHEVLGGVGLAPVLEPPVEVEENEHLGSPSKS